MRLREKNIVLLGGATGIGNRAARMISDEGANIVVGDINFEGADALAREVRALGRNMESFHVDLGSEDSIRAFMENAHQYLGSIDGLFLNGAAVDVDSLAKDTDVLSMDIEHWEKIMSVNLRGYLLSVRFAIPIMLENGGGSIVCTSSELSFIATGCKALPAYCMSKAGVNVLICHVASQFGRQGIRCNGVAPGFIDVGRESGSKQKYDQLICTQRLGVPEDIGAAVIHLLSDESEYIQGQMISVNGGSLFR
jgi:NAD(P)-dependent dehydrogenase (short-subunit alcohol dehydrogenase family)